MKKRLVCLLLALGLIVSALPVGAAGASESETASVTVGGRSYALSVGDDFIYRLTFDYAGDDLASAQIELPVDFDGLSSYTQTQADSLIAQLTPATSASSMIHRFDTPNTFGLSGYVMNFASVNGYSFTSSKVVLSMGFRVEKAGSYTLSAKVRSVEDVSGRIVADDHYAVKDDRFRFTETFADVPLDTPAPKASTYAGGVLVSWEPVPRGALYRVYRKNNGNWSRIGDTSQPSFLDTGVENGGTYTYTVRCLSVDATRFLSDYDRTGASATYCTAPILSLSNTDSGVGITWDAVPGVTRYRVYRKSGNSWARLADTAGTSALDTDVTPYETYTYTIRTLNSAGNAFLSYFYPDGFSILYLTATGYLLGDADDNGAVESVDAAFILRYIAQMDVPAAKELIERGGDTDGDGAITAMDATYIQAYLAQMKVDYPISQTV